MKCYVIPTIIHYMQQKRTSNRLGSFLRMWYTVTIVNSIIIKGVVILCMHSYKSLILYKLILWLAIFASPLMSQGPYQVIQHP